MNICIFKKEDLSNISCAEDFYKRVGLYDLFKAGVISSVYQMKINQKTFDFVYETILKNWKKCSETKHMSSARAKGAIGFDWCNHSPVCQEDVPEWTIVYE